MFLWDMMPHYWLIGSWHFETMRWFHLQGLKCQTRMILFWHFSFRQLICFYSTLMKIGVVVDHVFPKIKFTRYGLLACTKIYFTCQFQGRSPPPTKRDSFHWNPFSSGVFIDLWTLDLCDLCWFRLSTSCRDAWITCCSL